jgi:hypothetical protein
MNTEYQHWIAENVVGDGRGKCAEVTQAMAKAFPELTRVRGHYQFLGIRPHWWLTDPQGTVVDPTAAQFPAGGEYVSWGDGPEPIGRCYNCGELVYDASSGSNICSSDCYSAYRNFCIEGLV